MLVEVNCDTCYKKFYKRSSDIKRTKNNYCSYKCSNVGKRKNREKICLNCSKKFSVKDLRQKFCSHSCAAIFNNKKNNKKNSHKVHYGKGICLYCQKEFIKNNHRQKFCSSECHHKKSKEDKIKRFLSGELNDNTVRSKTIKKYIMGKQGGVCAICGNSAFHNKKNLVFVFDHIDGCFENNDPENIRLVCPNCNSQLDTFSGRNIGKNKDKRHKKRYRK